jgi:hypothetical protein
MVKIEKKGKNGPNPEKSAPTNKAKLALLHFSHRLDPPPPYRILPAPADCRQPLQSCPAHPFLGILLILPASYTTHELPIPPPIPPTSFLYHLLSYLHPPTNATLLMLLIILLPPSKSCSSSYCCPRPNHAPHHTAAHLIPNLNRTPRNSRARFKHDLGGILGWSL